MTAKKMAIKYLHEPFGPMHESSGPVDGRGRGQIRLMHPGIPSFKQRNHQPMHPFLWNLFAPQIMTYTRKMDTRMQSPERARRI
jgi:hypothetical protein